MGCTDTETQYVSQVGCTGCWSNTALGTTVLLRTIYGVTKTRNHVLVRNMCRVFAMTNSKQVGRGQMFNQHQRPCPVSGATNSLEA